MLRGLIFLLAILFTLPLHSQLVNKESSITITEGGQLTATGNFVNEGTVLNDGSISLRTDWISTGEYEGNGRLMLSGNMPQLFRHNGDPVYLFRIQNPMGVRLDGNLPISGKLDLFQGTIITREQDTLLVQSDAEITPGNPGSFVDGPLHHEGTGRKLFPIGIGRDFRPIVLNDVKGEGTVTRMWVQRDLEYEEEQSGPGGPGGGPPPGGYDGKKRKPEGIANLSAAFFWERENYNSNFGGSPITLPLTDELLSLDLAAIVSFNEDGSSSVLSEVEFSEGEYFTEITSLNEFYGEVLVIAEKSLADERAFYIPNALNPSAMESENQVIKVYGDVVEEGFLYVVYDRRGIEIFRTEDLSLMQSNGWDGTYTGTGRRVPAGAYVYAVKGFTQTGNKINQTGSLIIVQ